MILKRISRIRMAMDWKHITFEDYLSLCRDQDTKKLNTRKLGHVLAINGFGGIKNLTRKELIDAVKSVTLIPPTRSTVNHSPDQPIASRHLSPPSLQELRNDIQEMGWQECPIGSIVTVDPATIGVVKSPVQKFPVKVKIKRIRKSMKKDGNELPLLLPCANRDDIEMGAPDIKNSLLNKKKRVRKVKKSKEKSTVDNKKKRGKKVIKTEGNELALALPSAELLADVIAYGDDIELTSPKEMKNTSRIIRVSASMLNDVDEFSWINKGSQKLKASSHPRTYFKCKNFKKGCPAKKIVDQDTVDPSILIITYYHGEHNHSAP